MIDNFGFGDFIFRLPNNKKVSVASTVDDFIEGLVRAMDIDHLEYPANVGQQKGYSILESAKMVKEACGFEGELVHDTRFPDGDPVKILGNSKFNDLFPNFEFFDHEEGIKNTVSYYMDKV